ncbi:hypothetical protein AVEN_273745-1 [Araneus ventricosus]|uniref:Uncharacterized protein n=1 Tax=Araneus ventricosus TaxID=182803 RepID=A0A4Y2RC96_ARAVE|nr:hypothetical protein AVEN_273745-1 [Araneus ventricosus]
MRLYKTLILPVLPYASDTWTLNVDVQLALETFERKVLRTIFGHVLEQGCWRTRYNFELYRLYEEPQVTKIIRSNRLRCLGHVWRTPENNPTRLHTFKNSGGARAWGAYRHSVLKQSTVVTLEGSDWTSESDVTLLHIASTVRHAYLVYSS